MTPEPDFTLPRSLAPALEQMRKLAGDFSGEMAEAAEAMKDMDGQATKLSRSLSSSLKSAFDKAVFGGAKLSSVFRDLASTVAGKALNAAISPVTDAISGGFSGIFGGLSGALTNALGFKDGGAFSSGRVRAFAQGGVVDGPTYFPMKNGTGLMGEAGPEAIMPLTRGPDGRLGVQARGGSSAPQVIVNIHTPDIAGFQRSRGQVASQLARAVRRGQGGL